MLLLPLLLACQAPVDGTGDALPSADPGSPWGAVALARTPPHALDLPASSREEGAPGLIRPTAPFVPHGREGDVQVWATPLPVDVHLLLWHATLDDTDWSYVPPGLEVRLDGVALAPVPAAQAARSWGYDGDHLYVGLPARDGAPQGVEITWPQATLAERALHLQTSGRTPEAFALRTQTVGTRTDLGVLLPAPARATWTLTVPPAGMLGATVRILPPVIRSDRPSDGATLTVSVDGEDLPPVAVTTEEQLLRLDLARWAGRTVELALATSSDDPRLDLVFLEDPVVYTPTDHPRTVVLAFVDTVRADHLGMYGYDRPTTPRLDAWARGGTRFDRAHTVAPWTLPSTLAMLTGQLPEVAPTRETLAELLGRAGFATSAFVANAYLAPVFGTHRGFGRYTYRHLRPARAEVDDALGELARWPDRDRFVLVQFMEAHLPYDEPVPYRGLFERNPGPVGFERPWLEGLRALALDDPRFEEVREYVIARYDQNLRVLDDEVARLFEAVGGDAVTMLVSDHGEEFWDHGTFEHGHTFHEEVLRVPMVLRGPGVPADVSRVPTSVLDVTPTLLDAVGLPGPTPAAGLSLLDLALGQSRAFEKRRLAFGHPLYGELGWGVWDGPRKWWDRDGPQRVFDLATDPGEFVDLAATTPLPRMARLLARALRRPVHHLWRLRVTAGLRDEPVTLGISHPDGLAKAWLGDDPRALYEGTTLTTTADGDVRVTAPAGVLMNHTIYLVPAGDVRQPAGLAFDLHGGGLAEHAMADELVEVPPGAHEVVLANATPWHLWVDIMRVPEPGPVAVRGYAEEVAGALEELGYVE